MPIWLLGLLNPLKDVAAAMWGWVSKPANWPLIIIGVLVVVLWISHGQTTRAKADAAKAQADNVTLAANVKTLTASIASQNTAVAALRAAGDARTAAANHALQQARVGTATASKVAAHVEAYTAPAGEPDTAAALDILKGRADQ
jgi:hypothetical protein